LTRIPDNAAAAAIGAHFEIPGTLREVAPLGSGHIHDTFVARFEHAGATHRYVHQRLNTEIFRDPAVVMRNLERICAHLRDDWKARGARDAERRCLRLVPTREGRSAHVDDEGRWWRCFPFQEGTRSVDTIESAAQAFEAARCFGHFAAQLDRLPGPPLPDTLPHFHDAARRFADLERALAEDPMRRARSSATEWDAARRVRDALADARLARGAGALTRRAVHNDCKINNLLFDADTGEGLCVVDLDTVMEGDLACDFGELVRTGACPAPEDERSLARVRVDPELLSALCRGYVAGAGELLGEAERRALPLAGATLALENAFRFLTDHLRGDRYFRIHRPDQNLDRARAQLHLAARLLEAADRVASQLAAPALEGGP
jgi:Ser/Thr protein kinase RdoA (MazF antagonist)